MQPRTIDPYCPIYWPIYGPILAHFKAFLTAIMDMIRAPLSKQTCCTSTRDCSINIESINFKLSRHKARNIIQVQGKLYYEIPHSS